MQLPHRNGATLVHGTFSCLPELFFTGSKTVVIPEASGNNPQAAETVTVETTINFLLEPSEQHFLAVSVDSFFVFAF